MTARVQVMLDSGQTIDMLCDEFTVTRNALGGIARLSWVNATPSPMHIDVDHVAAVVEVS